VTTTVVCSELDAERARAKGVARVAVVPNGYRRVEDPVGGVEVGSPPTVLFAGTLRYPPNAEAARFLVGEVRPQLVALVPDVRIRLVGLTTPALSELDDPPGVSIVGQVPDMGLELAGADLVVVPLRFGSGTRLKVLEAFAQRVPVVSTSLGAEGLDAEDGVHLLIADTPAALAAACARLLTDRSLRRRIVEHAHQLFLARFQSEVVEREVAELARSVVGESAAVT
jgi:glycosyltransferase involved in cell wall biosynthesis